MCIRIPSVACVTGCIFRTISHELIFLICIIIAIISALFDSNCDHLNFMNTRCIVYNVS